MQGTGRLPTMRPFDFSAVLLAASSGASIDVENIAAAANLPTVPPTLPGVGKRTGAAAPLAVAVGADGFDDVNDFWAQAVKPHTPALPNPAAAAARRRGPLAVATPAIAAARAAAQAEVDALARRLPTPGRSVQDDGPASPSFLPSPLPHEGVSPSAEVPSPPSLGGSPDVDDVDVDGDGSDVPTPEPSEEPLDSEAEEARRLEEEEEERRKDAEGVSSDEEGNRSADHAEEPSSAVSPSADSVATGESKAPEVDSDDGSVGAGAGAGAGAPAGDTSSQDAHGRGRGRPSITNKAAAEAGARQGKRRSARRRWAPLKYWAGERVVYRHKQGALFAEKVRVCCCHCCCCVHFHGAHPPPPPALFTFCWRLCRASAAWRVDTTAEQETGPTQGVQRWKQQTHTHAGFLTEPVAASQGCRGCVHPRGAV